MIKKLLVALSLLASPAWAATVNQSGSVTAGHAPYWVTNGAIGDGGTSADSPITSIGVTNNGGSGICVNSARQSAAGYNALCLGASTTGAATISLQNYGTAGAQALQFVINGTTYAFPGSLANITIGVTPVVGGVNADCLVVSAGVVGQQPCNVSAITSLTGDVTGTGPGVTATTLATVNSNVGTFGNGSTVPSITVNGKGLITAVSTSPVSVTVGTSGINSGSNQGILYDNGGVFGNLTTLGSSVLVTSVGGVPSMATTLPSALTIPTPTFTGTLTFPDAATWTSAGISKVSALSAGSATIPAAGNINLNGQYQVNGTQIAATNLLDGKTGTGALVGAAGPTISGTWAGAATFSGANTYSGNDTFTAQAIFQGTSAPASAGGNTVVMGTIAAPTLTSTGQAFVFNTVVGGAFIEGDGSTSDFTLANKSAGAVFTVPTGTTKLNFPSLASGTCASGLGLDSGNNTVLVSCPGAASSIQVGTTTITSGSSGKIEFNNAGVLGELTIGNGLANSPAGTLISTVITEPQGRLTLTANTPVMTASASAQTTLRYDCYIGGQVPYFNGTNDLFDTIASCEVTDAMVSAASAGQVVSGQVYDVWWVHGGANRICLAMSASVGGGGGWASDTGGSNTARGTGYSQLDRITRPYTTNKNAITNCFNGATNYGSVSANQGTYLGTVTASANGQISWTLGASASGGTAAVLGVWNMYNRVNVGTNVTDSGTSYLYSSATIRQARNSAGNQVTMVLGLQEDSVLASYSNEMGLPTTNASVASSGIGLDVTNAFSCQRATQRVDATASQTPVRAMTPTCTFNILGLHVISANESADASGTSMDNNSTNVLAINARM